MRAEAQWVGLVAGLVALAGCSTAKPVSPPPQGEPVSGDRALILFAEAAPESGPAPLTVQFAVWDPFSNSEDPQFTWDFGDGSPVAHERRPVHVYEEPGQYTVRFSATDTDGLTDDDELEIEVEEP